MQPIRSKYLVITSDYVFPGLIIISVLILFWLAFYSSFFNITSISCQIDYEPCENSALEAEINKYLGVNILRLNQSELKKLILSGEFTIRSVEIKRTLPGSVLLSLQSVLPSLAVHAEGDMRYITLDSKYRVIKITTQKPNLLVVQVPSLPPVQVGKVIGDKYIPLFQLSLILNSKISGVKDVFTKDLNTASVIINDLNVILSTSADIDRQIRLLQAVLTDSTILKGKKEIDVRFSQPVLR